MRGAQCCLRFLGWLQIKEREAGGERDRYDMTTFADPKIGNHAEAYLKSLEAKDRKFSTLASYAHSLLVLVQYTFRKVNDLQPAEQHLYRLRAQAEKQAKTDQRFAKRHKNWITWAEAQVARIKAVEQWERFRAKTPLEKKRKALLLRRAILVALMTVLPPVSSSVCVYLARVDVLRAALARTRTALGFCVSSSTARRWWKTTNSTGGSISATRNEAPTRRTR